MPKRDGGNSRIVVSGRDTVKALGRQGFDVVRMRGDHALMREKNGTHSTQVDLRGKNKEALGQGR
ncbi:MAG: hypothetical protein M1286_01920 [Candidatus Marsarchaeota archaeon]|nr:hypothetical protein [Candidatus Marsarchaeota archaeon]